MKVMNAERYMRKEALKQHKEDYPNAKDIKIMVVNFEQQYATIQDNERMIKYQF